MHTLKIPTNEFTKPDNVQSFNKATSWKKSLDEFVQVVDITMKPQVLDMGTS